MKTTKWLPDGSITITFTKAEAAKAQDDLKELARHFDLDAFFESEENTIKALIEALEAP